MYKLVNSRFVEKYDKKVPTSIKRHISAFEQKAKIHHAYTSDKEGVLVLHRRNDKLNLWLLNQNSMDKVLMLAEINKKGDSHIVSANISSSGNYIAYSDSNNTIIFSYDFKNNDLKKIKSLKNHPSKFLYFTNDENSLISIDQANNKVHIYDIRKEIFSTLSLGSSTGIILSSDYFEEEKSKTKLLALSSLNCNLIVVNLSQGSVDDSYPHPSVFLTQLKFLNKDTLLTIGEDNKFFLVDVENKKFSDWTNKNINNFPKNYLRWYNKIMGVTSDESEKFLLYTDYNYIKVDLNKEIPDNSVIAKDKAEKLRNAEWSKKIREYHKAIFNQLYKNMKNTQIESEIFREEANEESQLNFENDNFRITSRFSSIIYMAYLQIKEESSKVLLVIENDWNKILKIFPETVSKYNYGF